MLFMPSNHLFDIIIILWQSLVNEKLTRYEQGCSAMSAQSENQIFKDFNGKADELAADVTALYPNAGAGELLESLQLGAKNLAVSLKAVGDYIAKFGPKDQVVIVPLTRSLHSFADWMMNESLPETAFLCPSDANERLGVFMAVAQGHFMDMLREPQILSDPKAVAHFSMGLRMITKLQAQLDLPSVKKALPMLQRTCGIH